MRIYFLGPAHPFRGGLAAFSHRLAEELLQLGHQVELLTFTAQYPALLFPGKTQFEEGPPPLHLKIRPVLHAYHPWKWPATARLLAEEAPDILICPYWHSFMAPAFAQVLGKLSRNGKTHIVGLIHNLIPHEPKFFDRFFANYFLQRVHACLTLSASVAQQIQELKPNCPVRTFPHPMYDSYGPVIPQAEARRRLGLNENSKIVLFFGFIRAYKGLDLLLEALRDTRLEQSRVELLVAGEFYEKKEKYETWLKPLAQDGRLILRSEFIPHNDVGLYFCAADLVVQPYRNATQSGISQLAYHFGLPMVVTNVGGLSEIVKQGKSGYVVEPQADALADAIDDFFSQDRAEALREGVQEEKQRFSWRPLAQALLELSQLPLK